MSVLHLQRARSSRALIGLLSGLLLTACDEEGSQPRSDSAADGKSDYDEDEDEGGGEGGEGDEDDDDDEGTAQGWTKADQESFYHDSIGTALFPAAWVQALTYPTADGDEIGLFSAEANALSGQITAEDPALGIVGGTITKNPFDGQEYWGPNCAWCHTADIHFDGKTIRIDGSGATASDGFKWFEVAGTAIITTAPSSNPTRFDEFAARLEVTDEETKAQLAGAVEAVAAIFQQGAAVSATPVDGPGRADGVTAAINTLLTSLLIDGEVTAAPQNVRNRSAPVAYPSIWRTNNHGWFHWTASIRQTLARDIWTTSAFSIRGAETDEDGTINVHSFVDFDQIQIVRNQLDRLKAPQWPEDILGELDEDLVEDGRKIYENEDCGKCHDLSGAPIVEIPTWDVGTDTAALDKFVDAAGFDVSWLVGGETEAPGGGATTATLGEAFKLITDKIIDQRFEDLGWSQEQQDAATLGQNNDWVTPEGYQATELCGIWATAPYLHNNSVSSLWELFLPATERMPFWFGGPREFDPQKVGYETDEQGYPSERKLDTTQQGNRNTGHEYGSHLGEEDRRALIEYLKSRTCDSDEGED